VIKKYIEGDVLLEFNQNHETLLKELNVQGDMPLPPYIKRDKKNNSDKHDYQTIFACNDGAVACAYGWVTFYR
jgi:S-adenosylmethionine:tRNA-ribosyltransferase-isomerase (queuine synthetase)